MPEFIHGSNDDPRGVSFVELPEGWDEMSVQDKDEWMDSQVADLASSGVGYVREIVDSDLPDYDREIGRV